MLLAAASLGYFWWWRQTHPAPSRLTRASFADLSGWSASDAGAALASFRRGCAVLATKPSSQGMFYAGTLADWRPVCAQASSPVSNPRKFFEDNFTPYAISGPALFTGYYEPQIEGARDRHGAYQTPVYGAPADLVRVDLGQFIPKLAGEHVSGRLDGHHLVPYATRADIDAHGIAGAPILFWCDDPVALFFLQIQGSGRVRFEDGQTARVAYAGENGRPYTAIGRALIQKGVLTRENVSLASIRDWLRTNPKEAQGVMEQDQSFVFFQVTPLGDTGVGSPGTLGAAADAAGQPCHRCAHPSFGRAFLCLDSGARSHFASDDRPGHRRRHKGRGAGRHIFRLWRGSRTARRRHEIAKARCMCCCPTGWRRRSERSRLL